MINYRGHISRRESYFRQNRENRVFPAAPWLLLSLCSWGGRLLLAAAAVSACCLLISAAALCCSWWLCLGAGRWMWMCPLPLAPGVGGVWCVICNHLNT